jgi:hypothetical protein
MDPVPFDLSQIPVYVLLGGAVTATAVSFLVIKGARTFSGANPSCERRYKREEYR